MSDIEIELHDEGFQELLKSEEIGDYISELANNVANRAEGNYEADVQTGKYRKIARVKTADQETYYRNMKNNYLLKALGTK